MRCPNCGSFNSYVVDTMHGSDNYIYRRRKCRICGTKFKTAELEIINDEALKQGYVDAYYSKTKNRFRKE